MSEAGSVELPVIERLSGHPSPAAIMAEIAALDAESAKVLRNVKAPL